MNYILTFFAVFFTDIVNTYYIKAIAENKPLVASILAALVMLIYSFALISFVKDIYLLIPALLGAFAGTYVAMIIKRKRKPIGDGTCLENS